MYPLRNGNSVPAFSLLHRKGQDWSLAGQLELRVALWCTEHDGWDY